MPLLIIASLIIALFVLIIIRKTMDKPSRRDGRLYQNLTQDSIDLEYQKQIRQ